MKMPAQRSGNTATIRPTIVSRIVATAPDVQAAADAFHASERFLDQRLKNSGRDLAGPELRVDEVRAAPRTRDLADAAGYAFSVSGTHLDQMPKLVMEQPMRRAVLNV